MMNQDQPQDHGADVPTGHQSTAIAAALSLGAIASALVALSVNSAIGLFAPVLDRDLATAFAITAAVLALAAVRF
jgi:hypothetical protein